jgi:hypothetical protein
LHFENISVGMHSLLNYYYYTPPTRISHYCKLRSTKLQLEAISHIIDYNNQFKIPRGLGRKGITTEIDSQYAAELAAEKQRFETIIRTRPA